MEERFYCPHCHADITEDAALYRKRCQMAAARAAITPEQRAEMQKKGAERLRKWRDEHPGEVRDRAAKASHARTADSFRRQGDTIRRTVRQKSLKFAELIAEAKLRGEEITPEVETALWARAAEIVKAESKSARKNAKR